MKFAVLFLLALLAVGCKKQGPIQPAVPDQVACIIKLGNAPDPTVHGWIAERVNYGMHLYSGNAWNSPRMRAAADTLRAINPRAQLGEYAHTMAIGQWTIAAVNRGATEGWDYDYYHAVMPYVARTNQADPATGLPDTAAIFHRNYCINLLLPGAVESLADFYVGHSKGLDWLMLDFMTVPMPDFRAAQGPRYVSEQTGDMDLDGDGVPHATYGPDGRMVSYDLDEATALRTAFMRLLKTLHDRAPSLLLIPNGQLALVDDQVAKLTDGVYVEGYAQWFFGAFGNDYRGALFTPKRVPSLQSLTAARYRNGRGLVLLEDRYHQMTAGYSAMCFEGAVEVQRIADGSDAFVQDLTRSLRWLGPAQGPATAVGDTLRRPFKNGSVSIVLLQPDRVRCTAEVLP